MKINVKLVTGETFSIEAEPSSTVLDVKKQLEAMGRGEHSLHKLIHTGRVLTDTQTLAEAELEKNPLLVLVTSKPKTAPAPAPAPAPTPAPAPAPSAPVAPAPVTPTAPGADAPADPSGATMFAMANANHGASDEIVAQLMELGYEKDQVERALRAAFGNADRAAEYLMTGIPEDPMAAEEEGGAELPGVMPPPGAGGAAPQAGAAAPPAGTPENAAAIQAALQAAMAAQQGQGTSPLAMLRSHPQFNVIRYMVQTNPQLLEPLMQRLQQENPDLVRLINENQAEFMQLLAEPSEPPQGMPGMPPAGGVPGVPGAGGNVGGMGGEPAPPVLQITTEEKEAIDRLCAMGFDRNAALQAYFACEKNEEMAANLLLSDFE